MEENKRNLLLMMVSNPGWEVILDLMESQCDAAEKELLRAPVNDSVTVVARHNTAQAYARFFEDFQRSVVKALSEEIQTVPIMTPLEIIERQIQG